MKIIIKLDEGLKINQSPVLFKIPKDDKIDLTFSRPPSFWKPLYIDKSNPTVLPPGPANEFDGGADVIGEEGHVVAQVEVRTTKINKKVLHINRSKCRDPGRGQRSLIPSDLQFQVVVVVVVVVATNPL